jgi:hypothetical protein
MMREVIDYNANSSHFTFTVTRSDGHFDSLAELPTTSADVPTTLEDLRTAMRIGGREAVFDAMLARNQKLIDGLVGKSFDDG